MRRRRKRKEYDPPDGYDPPILKPDNPEINSWKRTKIKQKSESPQDELLRIELNCRKILYSMYIGRWKISKAHSIKEYAV